ncbi:MULTISPECIES: hypothetical protein [Moorena]|uniref:Uncharacterized protein n=1 Tax=Moorena producens 3L TaxID=489825 RepID=F4XRV8_9CYAN|nr:MULTISPECIES: hypothetical protein [Moorena]NEQ14210.1 hypothetical protein [Moorena sp. SIO3E2]EGJ32677.1 hypothetical protein LYNGBM3L_05330 [Moorena producens 3L]NEP65163.1 hypothetical protein [Moorena sp. SIO3A5]NES41561.1 hypothetical protein [Moorena sp. SIO2C4]OLT67248.1 hypothetical protein BI334_21460 [Moorena producens 3L]
METIKLQSDWDSLALIELFCTEPQTVRAQDGYWCYEVTDTSDTTLKFGVNTITESIQIELKLAGESKAILSFELIESIEIIDYHQGKFSFIVPRDNQAIKTVINIELRPKIQVHCSTLSLSPQKN